jgi:hypothetical protein
MDKIDNSGIENVFNENVRQFRDLINSERSLFFEHLDKSGKWFLLCSAMDVIDDTTLAILAFEKEDHPEAEVGLGYLKLYGLLQAMYLQQNALITIGKCIDKKIDIEKGYPGLSEIRNVRTYIAGHPNSNNRATFITRATLNREQFDFEIIENNVLKRQRSTIRKLVTGQLVFAGEVVSDLTTAGVELYDKLLAEAVDAKKS